MNLTVEIKTSNFKKLHILQWKIFTLNNLSVHNLLGDYCTIDCKSVDLGVHDGGAVILTGVIEIDGHFLSSKRKFAPI